LAQKQINKISKQTNKYEEKTLKKQQQTRKVKTKTSQVPKHIMSIMGVLRGMAAAVGGVTLPVCHVAYP